MKKAILIAITVMAAFAAPSAHATQPTLNILITGGDEQNVFEIRPTPDGRSYVIDSLSPLEVGAGLCVHSEEAENRLTCDAATIASFEVNAGGGNDVVTFSPKVPVPVTLRGGPGDDRLFGGGSSDKLIGGLGGDSLLGRNGEDWLFGGRGNDFLFGGAANDRLVGGPGDDLSQGGPGKDSIPSGPGHDFV